MVSFTCLATGKQPNELSKYNRSEKLAKKTQSELDFFIRNANEANEPAQTPLANDSLNSQLLYEQSDQWNELNEANINTESSSTLSSTVSIDSSESEHEHVLTSQSDSVFCETTSKEIEVVKMQSL